MSDIAKLAVVITSDTVDRAKDALDRFNRSGKVSEDQANRIAAAAAKGGTATKGYAEALARAYNVNDKLSESQIGTIRGLEDQIAKTGLSGRALSQYVAIRQSGTRADSDAGRAIAALAGHAYDLSNKNGILAATTTAVSTNVGGLTARLGVAGAALAAMGPVGIAVGAALVAVGVALGVMVDQSLKLADAAGKLKDFGDTTEITTDALQALFAIGAQSGVSNEQLGTYLERLTAQFDQLGKKTGPLYEGLLEVNKGLANEAAEAGNAERRLTILSRVIQQADTQQRAIIGRAAAGRGFGGFIRTMLGLDEAGGVDKAVADFNKTDKLTKTQIENLDRLGDNIAELSKKIKTNVVSMFAESTLTGLESFLKWALDLSRQLKEFQFSDDLKNFIGWTKWLVEKASDLNNALRIEIQDWMSGKSGSMIPAPPATRTRITVNPLERENQALSKDSEEYKRITAEMQKAFEEREDALKKSNLWAKDLKAYGDNGVSKENMEAEIERYELLTKRLAELEKQRDGLSKVTALPEVKKPNVEADFNALKRETEGLGDATNAAEKYRLAVLGLAVAREKGNLSEEGYARAMVEAKAANVERITQQRQSIGIVTEEQVIAAGLLRLRQQQVQGYVKYGEEGARAEQIIRKEARETIEAQKVRAAQFPQMMRYQLDAANVNKAFDALVVGSLNKFEDALLSAMMGTKKLKQAFSDMATAILADIAKIILRMNVTGPLAGVIQSLGSTYLPGLTKSADGNAFGYGNVIPFARGGVIDRAVMQPMALMGEAGPEAIMPLTRGSNGKLGIESHGSAMPVIKPSVHVENHMGGKAEAEVGVGSDGLSFRVIFKQIENGLADRVSKGQGPLAKAGKGARSNRLAS